tara:strand:- start:373 stop:681 length:309 start_codon:yes stop_codon:yes gene_type:complete
MSIDKTTLLQLIQTVLKELGEDLEKNSLLDTNEMTPLFGSKSDLDSINLVNLITDIEERLSDEHDIVITLASASAMSSTRSPFLRVGSLVNYILELIKKDNE